MDRLAKKINQMIVKHDTSRTERKNIVFHSHHCYQKCLRNLQKTGTRILQTVDPLHLLCCHGNCQCDWHALSKHPHIAYIEQDKQVQTHDVSLPLLKGMNLPPEPLLAKQILRTPTYVQRKKQVNSGKTKATFPWNITRVQAPLAWKRTRYGQGIKVGILDTGISSHRDLRIAGGVNFTAEGRSYTDQNGHGTHVAGIVAGLGRRNQYGVAPKVSLYAVKVLDRYGLGYISDIIKGIYWAVNHRIRILNMSFGIASNSLALQTAIQWAKKHGTILVASAGNKGTATKRLDAPARYAHVIAVGATGPDNRVAAFSTRGPGISIAAPGVSILSTGLGGTYVQKSGTSMSAPHVTGAIALLKRLRPLLKTPKTKWLIRRSALKIGGGTKAVGGGLLQVHKAVNLL